MPLPTVPALSEQLATLLIPHRMMLATAESCTGGMVAAACTDLPGSSQWFDRAMVTYSNAAKTDLVNVPAALIEQHGAVSEPVARAMAEGAIARSQAHLSIAITGIAGPSGGTPTKPVGTVWFAWASHTCTLSEKLHLNGDRHAIRHAATWHALHQLIAQFQTLITSK